MVELDPNFQAQALPLSCFPLLYCSSLLLWRFPPNPQEPLWSFLGDGSRRVEEGMALSKSRSVPMELSSQLIEMDYSLSK